ncbi:MAG TPA: aminotransferase class V-fold PLP-dependent enzyme [Ignavibacteria bacterium]|nr:aminotransferase class V-fold PLP-dependent enzyme [Ignavibacteria bacterium]
MINKNIYLTPGPTELYPFINKYIQQAIDEKILSINHRSNEYIEIQKKLDSNLRALMNIPQTHSIFFVSSATECMDILIKSTVKENSFHFVNGAFAERFYNIAKENNKNATELKVEYGKGFENVTLENNPELIAFTQNETSTGVYINPDYIYNIKKLNPDSIIAVDIVTSAPYVNLDYSVIDASFFSVQKGFGLPAGLGVLIANEKVINKAKELKKAGIYTGSYHNILSLKENHDKYQTTETPNVLNIFLLEKVSASMLTKGIDLIRKNTDEVSNLVYNFFDEYKYKPFVTDKSLRSPTIIVINTENSNSEIKSILKSNGIIVGSGYGKYKNEQIRISNFPGQGIENYTKLTNILSKF